MYTCSMHPEVNSDKPGNCQKCGMELVESHREAKNNEKFRSHAGHHEGMDPMEHHRMMAADFKRRFFVTLPLTILTLVLSRHIQEWFGFNLIFPGVDIVLLILGTVIVFYGGKPFFQAAVSELKSRNWGMMTLVSLALFAGYIFSLASTFTFPGESIWWEISTLASVFLLGHWLEMRAVIGTGGVLKELARLLPASAHKVVKKDGKEKIEDAETSALVKGDIILVRPGEKLPADGIIIRGESSVNEAMITGESRPVGKEVGSEVIGGSINNDGSLYVEVTRTGAESALSQIMDLVRRAQETKPNIQKLADRAANWLTIIAVVVGSGTFIYWFFVNPMGVVFAATLAITVIVIACPHALGLAIPTVTTISTALAAKNGILIRDMRGLEVAKKIDWLVLDKTGTLTKGEFGTSRIITNNGVDELRLLATAAAVEVHSQHSIARGIIEEAKERKVEFEPAAGFKSIPGKGAAGQVNGKLVSVGNMAMMQQIGVEDKGRVNSKEGVGTLVYVAEDKKLLGLVILDDQIRPESASAIDAFHRMGIKVAMLTGDKKEVAEIVGKKLGIDTVFSEVLPDDKVGKIKTLQSKGNIVAMVGDGVNDAPALTQAHLGIAVGAGTSVAIESAEIVLVKSNPADIVKAIALSRKTNNKMVQNIVWATGYNALAIPAAAGVFFPWGILLRPEIGAVLMSASSIIVVLNALMLRRTKL